MNNPLLATDAFSTDLEPSPLDPHDVISGTPSVGAAELAAVDGVEIGIWEITAGVVTDVEVDEVFVVLAGRGEVRLHGQDPQDETIVPLAAGSVVRLRAGQRTTWTIIETLRKIYIALPTAPPEGSPSKGTP